LDKIDIKPTDELKKIKLNTRTGEGKIKRDMDDILHIYSLFDVAKQPLPRFYAADTSRVASFNQNDQNICSISTGISDIKKQLNDLLSTVKGYAAADAATIPSCFSDTGFSSLNHDDNVPWSIVLKRGTRSAIALANTGSSIPLSTNISKSPVRRKIVESAPLKVGQTQKIISSAINDSWHIFVGRLGKETSEDDVKDHLADFGITVSKVMKLKATQEWHNRNAAFKVSILMTSKDVVMDSNVWPGHVEVRDWYFKPREANQGGK